MGSETFELGVIGGGNMARAIVSSALASGFLQAGHIVVSDPLAERRAELADSLGIASVQDNRAAGRSRRVILAVKPQVMGEVLSGGLAEVISDETLVISIAAGVSSAFLDKKLSRRGRIVRVMPNTPIMVGAGASAISPGPRAKKDDTLWTRKLFEAGGVVVEVEEKLIDAVVAVSGSGPAYFFYLMEAMIQAGLAEGLDRETATRLAGATCSGAGRLQSCTGLDPAELRRQVTSPGGTTQRAIELLNAAGVNKSLVQAFRACADRSRELAAGTGGA
jgi:pyrroline-5-carboxylate reductase